MLFKSFYRWKNKQPNFSTPRVLMHKKLKFVHQRLTQTVAKKLQELRQI